MDGFGRLRVLTAILLCATGGSTTLIAGSSSRSGGGQFVSSHPAASNPHPAASNPHPAASNPHPAASVVPGPAATATAGAFAAFPGVNHDGPSHATPDDPNNLHLFLPNAVNITIVLPPNARVSYAGGDQGHGSPTFTGGSGSGVAFEPVGGPGGGGRSGGGGGPGFGPGPGPGPGPGTGFGPGPGAGFGPGPGAWVTPRYIGGPCNPGPGPSTIQGFRSHPVTGFTPNPVRGFAGGIYPSGTGFAGPPPFRPWPGFTPSVPGPMAQDLQDLIVNERGVRISRSRPQVLVGGGPLPTAALVTNQTFNTASPAPVQRPW